MKNSHSLQSRVKKWQATWSARNKGEAKETNEPAHEIMALFVLRKLILQSHMRSHPVGLDVWFLVGPFVYFHTSSVRIATALVRLCGCAGSHEPSLVAYVISTIISWTGSNCFFFFFFFMRTAKTLIRLSGYPVFAGCTCLYLFCRASAFENTVQRCIKKNWITLACMWSFNFTFQLKTNDLGVCGNHSQGFTIVHLTKI